MRNIKLKDHIKGKVRFQFYRAGELWYKTETELMFPVPISDTGDAKFLAEDKGLLFMRYIRKYLEELKKNVQEEFGKNFSVAVVYQGKDGKPKISDLDDE